MCPGRVAAVPVRLMTLLVLLLNDTSIIWYRFEHKNA